MYKMIFHDMLNGNFLMKMKFYYFIFFKKILNKIYKILILSKNIETNSIARKLA